MINYMLESATVLLMVYTNVSASLHRYHCEIISVRFTFNIPPLSWFWSDLSSTSSTFTAFLISNFLFLSFLISNFLSLSNTISHINHFLSSTIRTAPAVAPPSGMFSNTIFQPAFYSLSSKYSFALLSWSNGLHVSLPCCACYATRYELRYSIFCPVTLQNAFPILLPRFVFPFRFWLFFFTPNVSMLPFVVLWICVPYLMLCLQYDKVWIALLLSLTGHRAEWLSIFPVTILIELDITLSTFAAFWFRISFICPTPF